MPQLRPEARFIRQGQPPAACAALLPPALAAARQTRARRQRLDDPEELELLARSELGLVKPGEIPFVVVAPDDDSEQVRPPPADGDAGSDQPWYRRLGRALADLFGEGQ